MSGGGTSVRAVSDVSHSPVKDPARERPVPLVWRPVLRAVVEAIRHGDPVRAAEVPGVDPVSPETAEQIREYLEDYGRGPAALPEASWDSSVALWGDGCWEVLVDLYVEPEERSDLVLHLRVYEDGSDYRYEVGLVYVP